MAWIFEASSNSAGRGMSSVFHSPIGSTPSESDRGRRQTLGIRIGCEEGANESDRSRDEQQIRERGYKAGKEEGRKEREGARSDVADRTWSNSDRRIQPFAARFRRVRFVTTSKVVGSKVKRWNDTSRYKQLEGWASHSVKVWLKIKSISNISGFKIEINWDLVHFDWPKKLIIKLLNCNFKRLILCRKIYLFFISDFNF